jgi:RNA polymerase sigma factor (sigma-70 family)
LSEPYQPLMIHHATPLARCSTDFDMLDLVNEGSIGLMTLLDRLDAYEDIDGASLNALAFASIRGAMLNALRDRNGIVRLSDRTRTLLRQMAHVEQQLEETLGREPTTQEIAQTMQLTVKKVLELTDYQRRRSVESLEGLLEERDAADSLNFVSLFEAQVQADAQRATQMSEAIQAALATALTPRQQEVVWLRYGFDEGPCKLRTHETVASILGVRQSAVQVCDGRARARLSQALASVAASSENELSA